MKQYLTGEVFTGNSDARFTVVMSSGTAAIEQKDPGSSSWFELTSYSVTTSEVIALGSGFQYRFTLTGDATAYLSK